ncbi:hypothetical protein DFH09DRAFT_543815 [Mycena vulgaris]|nr:hypothetical protein DFH09DRAFT_543815 [Mycena vulgaris]
MTDPSLKFKSTDSTSSSDSYRWLDEWPQNFDGTGLFEKIKNGESSLFRFSIQDIFQEVEKALDCQISGVPYAGKGSNYFGIHVQLNNRKDALLWVRRCDVNWPRYRGPSVAQQAIEVEFEAATYRLLRANQEILASNLLYHRGPVQVQRNDPAEIPKDSLGRQIFVFEKAEGVKNVWPADGGKKLAILTQSACIRAALFRFELPLNFAKLWLPQCPPNPKVLLSDIEPTREFAIHFLVSKVEEMIKNEGDMIGWESDHNVVGPIAASAKRSLLRLIPLIFPVDENHGGFYRLVLEHGDFGIHNMTITDSVTSSRVTSLYDWETGHIVPALLSDPQIATGIDFEIDGDGCPILSGMVKDPPAKYLADYVGYANHYFKILDERAPQYIPAIKAGKDARHIWFALKVWRGDELEEYFGLLGAWADRRWQELVE